MKYYIIALLSLLSSGIAAQNIVKMSAVKSNDYGVAYNLPKTDILIRATMTKTDRKAGEFYRFAERYLQISNPVTEDETIYTLDKIEATTTGIADKSKSYLVEFKSNSVAPFVMLTKDGMICAINEEVTLPDEISFPKIQEDKSPTPVNPRSYLSEEILRAGSTAKQAELIAKQIYRLRETKTNILTGEADNMPPDGNAYQLVMKQLDEQEQALTSMFAGTTATQTITKEFRITPDEDDINARIVFRFSSKLGAVESNNLAGAPVKLNLVSKEPKAPLQPMTDKEQKAWDDKFSKGIIYNIPVKASLSIDFDDRNMVKKECDVVQYGTQEVLIPRQLEYKKDAPVKVIFYPDLGAIKQIIQ